MGLNEDNSLFRFKQEYSERGIEEWHRVRKHITGRIAIDHVKAQILSNAILSSDGAYIETGTLYGGSAILAALLGVKCWTIDPHPRKELIYDNLWRCGVAGRVLYLKKRSQDFVFPPRVTFSVGFIDGDHSHEVSLHDWKMFSENVTKYIILDNVDRDHTGVLKTYRKAVRSRNWFPVYLGYGIAVMRRMSWD